MTDLQIFLAICSWLVATALIGWAVFRFGYNLGWSERHLSMILPRNIRETLNARIDEEAKMDRHSAMDPKKVF